MKGELCLIFNVEKHQMPPVAPTHMEKIEALNDLINTVAEQSKREATGKTPNYGAERKAVRGVLKLLLGRSATMEEVELARAEVFCS